jgi:hypothetical protein
MASIDTVWVDPDGLFIIDMHVCAESLNGDWCHQIGGVHRAGKSCVWFAVVEVLPDGSGECVDEDSSLAGAVSKAHDRWPVVQQMQDV